MEKPLLEVVICHVASGFWSRGLTFCFLFSHWSLKKTLTLSTQFSFSPRSPLCLGQLLPVSPREGGDKSWNNTYCFNTSFCTPHFAHPEHSFCCSGRQMSSAFSDLISSLQQPFLELQTLRPRGDSSPPKGGQIGGTHGQRAFQRQADHREVETDPEAPGSVH